MMVFKREARADGGEEIGSIPEVVDRFDKGTWYELVDYITVFNRSDVKSTFKSSTEIKAKN